MRNAQPLEERFFDYVSPEPNSGCWLWTGNVHSEKKPYGRIGSRGRTLIASRASYLIHKGPIRKGMFVCHKCDNPNCVNPGHLFLASSIDNVRDRDKKGRQARGARHGCTKLTDAQVTEIRAATGSNVAIAKRFGASIAQVRRIRLNLARTDLNEQVSG